VAERVRVTFDTDLRRRRLAVLFRVVLVIPPLIVLAAWTVLAVPVLAVAWLATLVRGQIPRVLHRFLRGYVSYWTQVTGWWNLVTDRFPRIRRRDVHPVQLDALLVKQSRVLTFFRIVLAVPSLVLGSVLGVVLAVSAVAAWFVSLARGRTTDGLRELGAFCVRYQAEVLAYLLLLTPRVPRLGVD
jgi:Domain of unknown function (DUF4389)